MIRVRAWLKKLEEVVRPSEALERDFADELAAHIDLEVADNIRAGHTPENARRRALAKFGGLTAATDAHRARRTLPAFEAMALDLRSAMRTLRRRPAFTALVIATIGIGIGTTASIATITSSVLLRPLPYPDAGQLCSIAYSSYAGRGTLLPAMSDADYLALRQADSSFEATATYAPIATTLTGAGEAAKVDGATVTPDFFRVLRVLPAAGRTFRPDDADTGAVPVVLLSYDLWRSRFGSDPAVLNRPIMLDGVSHTVVGILPREFAFPAGAKLWTALDLRLSPGTSFSRPVIGRLKAGVTHGRAEAAFLAFMAGLSQTPDSEPPTVARVVPLQQAMVDEVQTPLLIFTGAVLCVLLVAGVNVANLLLVRTVARRQEIVTRRALGASRARIVRQLLTESALLGTGGGVVGVTAAWLGLPLLLVLVPPGELPRLAEIRLDPAMLVAVLCASVLTGLLCGIAPALQAVHGNLADPIRVGSATPSRRAHRLRHVLIVAEVALTVVLLVGAGLLTRSFIKLRSIDTGFEVRNVVTMTVELPRSRYPDVERLRAVHDRLLESTAALPGVLSSGAIKWLPFGTMHMNGNISIEDGGALPPGYVVTKAAVSPGYFPTLGMPLSSGRDFTLQDGDGAPRVGIVSASLARTAWPDEPALGQRLSIETRPGPNSWLTVVGIVDDVRQASLRERPTPALYQPYRQVTRPGFLNRLNVAVAVAPGAVGVESALRRSLQTVDPQLAPTALVAMDELVGATIAEPRFHARLMVAFSLLALLLSAVGLYGVLSTAALERQREMGIRMALGAGRTSIAWMMVRRALVLGGVGLALGLVGAVAFGQVLTSLLFDVAPRDSVTLAASAGIVLAVVIVSAWAPAARASRSDPLTVLRTER